MKLTEFASKILGLEKSIAGLTADKAKATEATLISLAGDVAALKTGAISDLEKTQSDYLACQGRESTATNALAKVVEDLKAACTAMKLEIKEGATALDMVSAMQASVSTTLARLQVPLDKIPAAAPAAKADDKPKTTLTGLDRMAAATRIQGITK